MELQIFDWNEIDVMLFLSDPAPIERCALRPICNKWCPFGNEVGSDGVKHVGVVSISNTMSAT